MEKIAISFQKNSSKSLEKHTFLKHYIQTLEEWNIDNILKTNISIIYPMRYEHYKLINDNKELLKKNKIKYLVPDMRIATIFKYKNKFVDWMIENDFKQYIPVKYNKIILPCVVKSINRCNGKGIKIIENQSDANNLKMQNYLIQEYIPGKYEYATHVLCKNGDIIMHKTNKYIFDTIGNVNNSKKNKITAKKKIEKEILEIFKIILKRANWNSFCCIDYRIVKNSKNEIKLKIFEINERIGGTLIRNSEELQPFLEKYIELCNH